MISVEEYLRNPCGMLSIPYWKAKCVKIPENILIVHQAEFSDDMLDGYNDAPYFRLLHSMKEINASRLKDINIEQVREEQVVELVDVINASYDNLTVTMEQLQGYRQTVVFDESLWIIARDRKTTEILGCGIADYDSVTKEGILEWIQVIPQYRRLGIGSLIVNELLDRLKGKAEFVTVSGKSNAVTKPEMLYRRCGFTGDDVWHVLTRKDKK